MTTTSRPGVVLVHGSWHHPRHWAPVQTRLETAGYDALAVDLPSCRGIALDNGIAEDVAAIREGIEHFTGAGRDVVVVMHSYGGRVGSDAIGEHMEAHKAAAAVAATATTDGAPRRGKIAHLFYATAMVLEPGVSIITEGFSMAMPLDVADGLTHHLAPYTHFYNTTPPPAARAAIGLIRPQAVSIYAPTCKHRGWGDYDIPLTFLECTQDRALLKETDQARFLARLEKAGLTSFTKKTLDCDHTPWLSKEEEFWSILTGILQKVEVSR